MIDEYFIEVKLSRAFANDFKSYLDWCDVNNVGIRHAFPEMIKKFELLNKHYSDEIERGIK